MRTASGAEGSGLTEEQRQAVPRPEEQPLAGQPLAVPTQAPEEAPDEPLDTEDAEEPGARAPVMAARVYVPT